MSNTMNVIHVKLSWCFFNRFKPLLKRKLSFFHMSWDMLYILQIGWLKLIYILWTKNCFNINTITILRTAELQNLTIYQYKIILFYGSHTIIKSKYLSEHLQYWHVRRLPWYLSSNFQRYDQIICIVEYSKHCFCPSMIWFLNIYTSTHFWAKLKGRGFSMFVCAWVVCYRY